MFEHYNNEQNLEQVKQFNFLGITRIITSDRTQTKEIKAMIGLAI